MRRANIVTSLVVLVIAAYIMYEAISMDYILDNVPGPGFIPLWTGGLMALIALVMLYRNAVLNKPESSKPPGFNRDFWRISGIVIGGSAAGMLLVYVIGMLAALGVLTGFLSWALGTKSKVTNVVLAVATSVVFWLLFEVALEVSFPKGIMGF